MTARARYEETLAHIQGDKASIEATLPTLGHATCLQGDYATVTACYGAARVIQLELGVRDGPTAMLHALGWVAYQQGDYPRATTLCAESLALSRASGDKQSEGMALRNLGYIAHLEDNKDRANTLFKKSLGALRELGNTLACAPTLIGVACVTAEIGELLRVTRLFGAAESVLGRLETRLAPANRAIYQQSVGVARMQLGELRFAEAWAEGQALTLEQAVAYALDSAATFP